MNVKTLFFRIILISALIFAVGCLDDNKDDNGLNLSIDPNINSIEFSYSGDKVYSGGEEIKPVFTVTTNQKSWNVVSSPEAAWLSVEKNEDETGFTVYAEPNNTFDSPEPAAITVSADNSTPVVITVTQKAIPTFKVGDYWPDADAVYKDGQLISGIAARGVVFWLDDQHPNYRDGSSGDGIPSGTKGQIIAMQHVLGKWSTEMISTGTEDVKDGLVNMAAIQSISNDFSNYPAFALVHTKNDPSTIYTPGAVDVWYLPSTFEWGNLYSVFAKDKAAFNNKIEMAGGNAFGASHYWSSNESYFGNDKACAFYFSSGFVHGAEMRDKAYYVRGIQNFSR